MSRHNTNRRRNYGRRQHELGQRPRRWQSVVRQWEFDSDAHGARAWSEASERSAEQDGRLQ